MTESELDPEAVRRMLDAKFGAWKASKQPTFRFLVRASAPGADQLGGVPMATPGTTWPACGECGRPLQFVAQLGVDADVRLLAFACAKVPCAGWGGKGKGLVAMTARGP